MFSRLSDWSDLSINIGLKHGINRGTRRQLLDELGQVAIHLSFEQDLRNLPSNRFIKLTNGVGQAFVNADNFNKPGPAMDPWPQTVLFLETNLK